MTVGLAGLLTLHAPPAAAAPPEIRNRLNIALQVDGAHTAALSTRIGERFRLRAALANGWQLEAGAHLRIGIRLVDGLDDSTTRLEHLRIRQLGVRLEGERLRLDFGRFQVEGGGFRLADGAQALGRLTTEGPAVWLGGWLGEVPEYWDTAPAPRFGGGPLLRIDGRDWRLSVTGEIAGGPGGLERAGGALGFRIEPLWWLEIAAQADLQLGAPVAETGRPALGPSDLGVTLRFDPRQDLRFSLFWTSYTSRAFHQGEQRDPVLSRFAERYPLTEPEDGSLTGAQLDPTLYHLVGFNLRGDPELPARRGRGERVAGRTGRPLRLQVRGGGRYRHHSLAERRYARGDVALSLRGMAGDRVHLTLSETVLWWGGELTSATRLAVEGEIGPERRVRLDGAVQVGFAWDADFVWAAPSLYADLFADVLISRALSLSAGYRFSTDRGIDRWHAGHAGLVSLVWRARSRRQTDEERR